MIETWIMSIVGVICLTALADIIMDDGETKKYVKCVCSLIVFAVIIAPIPKIFSNDSDINDVFLSFDADENIYENNNFVAKIKEKQLENYKLRCLEIFSEKGIENIIITPVVIYGQDIEITQIVVDATKIVITNQNENINFYEEISNTISSIYGVEKNQIKFVG